MKTFKSFIIRLFIIAVIAVFTSATTIAQTTTTFNCTGAPASFTVPPCVFSVNITAAGADGGGGLGGNGATVTSTLAVTPGQVITVTVGCSGTNAGTPASGGYGGGSSGGQGFASSDGTVSYNSSGGGGATTVTVGGSPYIVAAGGGGEGGGSGIVGGGIGGCAAGANGVATFGLGGIGATTTGPGAGGTPWAATPPGGSPGVGGTGGMGGYWQTASGGGGGGGYFGGGGGGNDGCCTGANGGGGGGGGSSLVPAGGGCTGGNNNGPGYVSFSYVPGTVTATVNSPTICAGQTATLTATGGTTYTWSTGATGNSINVSPATTTSYTVTAANGACTGSAVATVTVNPVPTITPEANQTYCSGDAVPANTFASTPAGATFTWTNSNTASGLIASGTGGTPAFTATNGTGTPITSTITITATIGTCVGPTSTYTITVNPTPVVTVNSPSICPATSATLTATGATTYLWNTGSTANPLIVSPASTTSYTVTGTSLGCTGSAIATVTVNATLLVNAGLNDSICFGGSAVLGVSPSGAGYLYNWTPAASLTGATTATPTASPAATTTYSVTLTDPSGCTGTSTVTIFADPQITMAIAGIDVTCNGACNGQTIVIPSGGSPAYTYLWSSGCTGASCTSLCPGSYTVTVTDSWGCTATATTSFVEPTLLTASSTVTPTSCNGVCDGTATATGAGGIVGAGYTYSWNTVPIQTTATATALCAGTYTCTITDANSCTATVTATITEPTLVVTAPIAPAAICFSGTTTLTASASGGNGGAYNYVWSPAGTGSTASVTVTPVGTTTYTVDATDVNGCPAAPVTVTVTVNPALSVVASGTASICPGASTNISALASFGTGGPYTYTWAPSGAGTPVSVSPAATTTYTVTASDGCSPTVTSTVTVTVLPLPVVAFSAPLTADCAPLCVNFTDNSTVVGSTIATSLWDFGDGNSSTSATPTNCYNTPGVYDITLTVTSTLGGCTSTSIVNNYVTVHPNPVADFIIPASSSIINPTVTYTDNSVGIITSWDWNFGDPFATTIDSTSTLQNPTHTFTEAGNYCATLTVTTNFGCVSTTTECIIIEPEFTFFIPNAFSPNGDNMNDEFYGKGDFILKFEMMIYDRWGDLIFFTDDINKHWNGIANNGKEKAQEDVYVYSVKITDTNNKRHKYIGTVTIVK